MYVFQTLYMYFIVKVHQSTLFYRKWHYRWFWMRTFWTSLQIFLVNWYGKIQMRVTFPRSRWMPPMTISERPVQTVDLVWLWLNFFKYCKCSPSWVDMLHAFYLLHSHVVGVLFKCFALLLLINLYLLCKFLVLNILPM